MPLFRTGNMFELFGEYKQVLLVTTNGVITPSAGLVMGAGAALQAKQHELNVGKRLAKLIRQGSSDTYEELGVAVYGVVWDVSYQIGAFQTKRHWKMPSEISVIKHSVKKLCAISQDNPEFTFNVNFPGIGLGGLSKQTIKPLLVNLPDNVVIWSFN